MLHSAGTSKLPWLALAVASVAAAVPLFLLDDIAWRLAGNTLWLAASVIAWSVPLGTALALLLFRFDLPLRKLWIGCLALCVFVPVFVTAAAWRGTLGITGWIHDTPAGTIDWLMLQGWRGAIWVHTAAAIPWVVMIVGLALRYAEPELEEDALTSGSSLQVVGRVTLRRAVQAAAVAALWVGVMTSTEIAVTDLFQVRTFAEELYMALSASGTTSLTTAQSAMANTTIAAWLAVSVLVVGSAVAARVKNPPARPAPRFPLRRWKWLAGIAVAAFLIALLGVPFGSLVYDAGITFAPDANGQIVRSWSLEGAARMIAGSPVTYHEEFAWSLQVACAAATCAAVIASVVCLFGRRGGWRSLPALVTASLALAIPGPLAAIAIIRLLNMPDVAFFHFLYDRTVFAPMLGQILRGLPLAVLVMGISLQSLPVETLESASTEGAGRWARITRIALPQRAAAVGLAWLAAFSLALGEVQASILLQPPGIALISPTIFGLLHGEQVYEVAGILLSMLAIFAVAGGLVALGAKRLGRDGRI